MQTQFGAFEIVVLEGVTEGNKHWKMYKHLRNLMHHFYSQSDRPYAIVCDDDMKTCPDFLAELNETVSDLPENWKVLHLCPGCLWGRSSRNKEFSLKPERDIFLKHCLPTPRRRAASYVQPPCWFGGPIAMLLNRRHIKEIIAFYDASFFKDKRPNDTILTTMASEDKLHFTALEPQLCIEEEEGGLTFSE